MIIKCYRCDKEIDTPNKANADYIIADDTVVREPRETLIALSHNLATKSKEAKMKETETFIDPETEQEFTRPKYPDLKIDDSEYDEVEVPSIKEAQETLGEDFTKAKAEIRDKNIQKTGIICPDCYRAADFVIWGVHKGQGVEKLEEKQ